MTVVFTDVVGSTAWRARVGDDVADVRLAELGRASRQDVEAAVGSLVKSVGDGVMATFGSSVAGLEAAAALQVLARRLAIGGDGHRWMSDSPMGCQGSISATVLADQ